MQEKIKAIQSVIRRGMAAVDLFFSVTNSSDKEQQKWTVLLGYLLLYLRGTESSSTAVCDVQFTSQKQTELSCSRVETVFKFLIVPLPYPERRKKYQRWKIQFADGLG